MKRKPVFPVIQFMRSILIILLVCSQLILKVNATTTINYPGHQVWKEYFKDKLKKVQAKLYNAALEGKIKAYYSDSFTGTCTRDELLKPQAAILSALPGNQDTDPSQASASTDVIKGICFIQKTTSTAFEFNTRQDMCGVALLIEFFGINFPFAYLKTDDLKSVLKVDELNFLSLLAYHGLHGNGQWVRPDFDIRKEDAFFSIHFSNYTRYYADTTLIEKMASMLYLTPDFIKMTATYHPEDNLFIDLQTGKPISHTGFCNIYNYTYDFFTKENGYPINSITMPDKVPQFNILFPINNPKGSIREIKLTLSFKVLEDKGLMPVHTWFFKDYIAWKE